MPSIYFMYLPSEWLGHFESQRPMTAALAFSHDSLAPTLPQGITRSGRFFLELSYLARQWSFASLTLISLDASLVEDKKQDGTAAAGSPNLIACQRRLPPLSVVQPVRMEDFLIPASAPGQSSPAVRFSVLKFRNTPPFGPFQRHLKLDLSPSSV